VTLNVAVFPAPSETFTANVPSANDPVTSAGFSVLAPVSYFSNIARSSRCRQAHCAWVVTGAPLCVTNGLGNAGLSVSSANSGSVGTGQSAPGTSTPVSAGFAAAGAVAGSRGRFGSIPSGIPDAPAALPSSPVIPAAPTGICGRPSAGVLALSPEQAPRRRGRAIVATEQRLICMDVCLGGREVKSCHCRSAAGMLGNASIQTLPVVLWGWKFAPRPLFVCGAEL
jgi:hypothetical protein